MDKQAHPIRSGIIVAVVAALLIALFVDPIRRLVFTVFTWIWSCVVWVWDLLLMNYYLPGWGYLIFGIFALIGLVTVYQTIRPRRTPDHEKFKTMNLYDMIWKWSWLDGQTNNLWCFCPMCDAELVHNTHVEYRGTSNREATTFFCEICNREVTTIGGPKNYILEAVDREIRRRIRKNEYNAEVV
jgi:hypothetical protein